MVERPDRYRVGDHPRDASETEWEVFVRDGEPDPLRHVGSVTAPAVSVAYEQTTKLFGWYATHIWVCPADAMHRYSTHDLDADAEPAELATGDEERVREP